MATSLTGKYILGGGLISLIARDILGHDWQIISTGKSRFYGKIPLADNHIVLDSTIDGVIRVDGRKILTRSISYGGNLHFWFQDWLKAKYLAKVYGEEYPRHFERLLQSSESVSTMDGTALYASLKTRYESELEPYKISEIKDGKITTDKGPIEFNNIISTIPLDALYGYISIKHSLQAKDVWVYHIISDRLDLEGSDQSLVADDGIDFYKVDALTKSDYAFYCLKEIITPHEYFRSFMPGCLIANSTHISNYIPLGNPIDQTKLKDHGIECIGSYAQWDDFADISSSIKRILKYNH